MRQCQMAEPDCFGLGAEEEEARFKNALLELLQFIRNDKVVTLVDKILAEGRAKGQAEGNQKMVLGLLKHRFGTLPQHVLDQVKAMKPNQLEKLSVKILNASNGLKELGLVNGTPPK